MVTQMQAALKQGVKTISNNDSVTFTQYVRTVLPADGFVFWVQNDILGTNNQVATPAPTIVATGSLHYAAERRQDERGTVTVTRVIFTTSQAIHQGIEDTNPTTTYIGTYDGLRFSFSSFDNYYEEAGLWHYVGDAITSDMDSQIIDSPADLVTDQVLSNSMPLWMLFSNYVPSGPAYGYSSPTAMYPGFLVPSNLVPPYAGVDIVDSRSIVSIPFETSLSSDFQLTRDVVKVTTYGLRNEEARRLIMCVLQRSTDYNEFGLLNEPIVTDEKQNQVELGILAMRKSITFEIAYHQGAVRNIARQLIEAAIPTYVPNPNLSYA